MSAGQIVVWRLVATIPLIIGLSMPGEFARADQTDARLDALFARLTEVGSAAEAGPVEARIWQIWVRSGRDDVDVLMAQGIAQMHAGRFPASLNTFDRVVEMAPEFAEGWNKRATVHYLLDNYAESVHDIGRTLDLEPRHFGAISGMGLILVETGDDDGAAQAFEWALRIHPHAVSARENLERIRDRMRDGML